VLENSKLMAFVATRDAARAKAFYGQTLGLRLVSEDRFAVVFDSGGTMLRVTIVPKLAQAEYTILGWQVPDIRAAVENLSARGIKFERYGFMQQDERGVWIAPSGARVAWFKDPEGNVLSLTQFPDRGNGPPEQP
jgi:catechol 2,3-dioxygenase-like lactoylglutathione lyase family enzyme